MQRFTVFDVETLNCMSADGITVILYFTLTLLSNLCKYRR